MKITAQIQLFSGVSFLDKLLFTKHLSVMVKSGITVPESLETLLDQTKSPTFKKVLSQILANVQNGQSLASSLAKHPGVFDQFYVSLVQIGEESGTLEGNLAFLATQLNKDYSLSKKVQGAMLYPVIVLMATLIMSGSISIFILPKLVDFFSAFDVALPLTTRILLFFANLMKNYGILIFAGIFGLLFLTFLLIQLPPIKKIWHRLILHLPLIGNLTISSQLARFCRNLGTLLKSGIPLVSGLETTANTLNNLSYQEALSITEEEIKKGKPLANALPAHLFAPIVIKMIAIGEKTGKLDETLLYLSDFYDDEIDNFTKNLTTVLEPILLLTIGLVVAFVALAIISPIYQLTGSIRTR